MTTHPLDFARAALADGQPWAARDRLSGVLAHRADDPEVLDLLGQAW